jgi:hypothetical protein
MDVDAPPKNRKNHIKLKGFARCIHTCDGRKCTNPSTKTLDWAREGGAVVKHAKSRTKHRNCSPACEGWSSLKPSGAAPSVKGKERAEESEQPMDQTEDDPAGVSPGEYSPTLQ